MQKNDKKKSISIFSPDTTRRLDFLRSQINETSNSAEKRKIRQDLFILYYEKNPIFGPLSAN